MNFELNNSPLESTFEFNDIKIKYKFRQGLQDRQHLLVVFSGFGWPKPIVYNFDGAVLSGCRSSILWIKDEFLDECTYYLCHKMNFSIESAIISLIDSTIKKLSLTRTQCTLLGASKGGSAALYYGIKYDFNNIIASCPQVKIGSYALNDWPLTAQAMQGNISKKNTEYLDDLIPNIIKNDGNKNRNIYLISSPNDIQYEKEIKPYLYLFGQYNNFNFIFTRSALAWQHNVMTRYNVPIILSIVYANGEGIHPRFGRVSNGTPLAGWESSPILTKQRESEPHVNLLLKATFNGDTLFPEGVGFIRGYPCADYGLLKNKLILCGSDKSYNFTLGGVKNKNISYDFFEESYCNYEAAGFASIKHSGVDLKNISCGMYTVKLSTSINKKEAISHLLSKKIDSKSISGPYEYRLFSKNGKLHLSKREILRSSSIGLFKLVNHWHKNNLIHFEGVFIIPGIELCNWGDANYYLVMECDANVFSFNLGMCHRPELNSEFGGHSIYQKSYFSTLGHNGIDISTLPKGNYKVHVAISHNASLFIKEIDEKINIE
ncbi:hypothetical protein [Plesiomonas sp.]|uniref:hypothetical protein n=1 Tax=Plesiomonas sp. TaxID=2486279 RepID=UPI003F39DD45